MTPRTPKEIADNWRAKADQLDEYAAQRRREGDTRIAGDAERSAVDYRAAADDYEAQQGH